MMAMIMSSVAAISLLILCVLDLVSNIAVHMEEGPERGRVFCLMQGQFVSFDVLFVF